MNWQAEKGKTSKIYKEFINLAKTDDTEKQVGNETKTRTINKHDQKEPTKIKEETARLKPQTMTEEMWPDGPSFRWQKGERNILKVSVNLQSSESRFAF